MRVRFHAIHEGLHIWTVEARPGHIVSLEEKIVVQFGRVFIAAAERVRAEDLDELLATSSRHLVVANGPVLRPHVDRAHPPEQHLPEPVYVEEVTLTKELSLVRGRRPRLRRSLLAHAVQQDAEQVTAAVDEWHHNLPQVIPLQRLECVGKHGCEIAAALRQGIDAADERLAADVQPAYVRLGHVGGILLSVDLDPSPLRRHGLAARVACEHRIYMEKAGPVRACEKATDDHAENFMTPHDIS